MAPSQAIRHGAEATDDAARAGLARVCAARRTTPAKLARRLSGDVDRIIMKALRVEPDRRYVSAGQLTEEIERLLDGRPVLAQPDTLMYRTRRFVGRHRVGVGTLAALVVLSTAFAVVAWLQARAVASERDRARIEARRAERVSLLVADLFKLAEPGGWPGPDHHGPGTARAGIRRDRLGAPGRRRNTGGALHRARTRLRQPRPARPGDRRARARAHAAAECWRGRHGGGSGDAAPAGRGIRGARRLRAGRTAPDRSARAKAPALCAARDVAATLEALGRTLSLTGRTDGARTYLEEAVALRRGRHYVPTTESMSGLYSSDRCCTRPAT